MHRRYLTLDKDIEMNFRPMNEDNYTINHPSNSIPLVSTTGETFLAPQTLDSSDPGEVYLEASPIDNKFHSSWPRSTTGGVVLETQDICETWKPPRPNREPTAEDWATHRHIFTELYSVQNKTLREVMEVMRNEYHFRATPRMFKQRIRCWGLKKYIKVSESIALDLYSNADHGTSEMPAGGLIHPRESSETDKTANPQTRKKVQQEFSDSTSCNQNILDSPAKSLSTPMQFKYAELLFHQVSVFYSASLDTTVLGGLNEGEIFLPGTFCHTVDKALSSLQRGIFQPTQQKIGWQLLNEASDSVQSLFRNKNNNLLRYLLRYAQRWYTSASPKLFKVLWGHISDMASLLLTENSPITLVCRCITHLDSNYEVYETAFRLILSNIEQRLGSDHDETTHVKEMYVSLLVESGNLNMAESLQRQLLEQYQAFNEYSQETMWAMYGLGLIMEKRGNLLEAEEAYRNSSLRGKVCRGEDYPSPEDILVMQHHVRMLAERKAFADCIAILSEALDMCLSNTSRNPYRESAECVELILTELERFKMYTYSEECGFVSTSSEAGQVDFYMVAENEESNSCEIAHTLEEDKQNEMAIAHMIWLMAREHDDRTDEQLRLEEDEANERAITELIQEMVEEDERDHRDTEPCYRY